MTDSQSVVSRLPAVLAEATSAFNRGDLDEAIRLARAAVQQAPGCARCLTFLGVVLEVSGQTSDAMQALERATLLAPDDPEPWRQMGCVFTRAVHLADRFLKAERCFDRAVSLEPDRSVYRISHGEALVSLGQYERAADVYQQALVLEPDNPLAAGGLAGALERKGQFEKARDVLRPFLARGDRQPQLAEVFAIVARHTGEELQAVKLIEDIIPDTPARMRINLHFAAGDLLDRIEQYDRAFGHYECANVACGYTYDPAVAEREMARLTGYFSHQENKKRHRASNRSKLPLLIVGMPRSGTTLVEQILACHSAVRAGGELEVIPAIVSGLPALTGNQAAYPECLDRLTRRDIDKVARRYIRALADIGSGAKRVTDKLPYNFINLGLVDMLLPSARVIHCVRDPVDTCLSIYFRHMSSAHPYTADLRHLGHYYRIYRSLMLQWESVLRVSMHVVSYESLVNDPAGEIRRLLEFCELPWEEACLEFHRHRRFVATPSYDQVRRPIYTHALGRWRHYRRHLEPLLTAFNRLDGC